MVHEMEKISICIPSLNRKNYLLQALHSIINGTKQINRVEVCISNNCSAEDYSEVESLIENYPFIKYTKQSQRISLDENMHACVKMANGDYIYYLGDDDYFFEGSVDKLFDLIDQEHPNLVILNGLNVDEFGTPMKRLFPCSGLILNNFNEAYEFHNANCMFGAILVQKKYLEDCLFEKFYGTSHAYMSFWAALAIQAQANPGCLIKVVTPTEPIVALRQAKKTYADYFLDALYGHMPLWYSIFQGFIFEPKMKEVVSKCVNRNYAYVFSFKFIARIKLLGFDVGKIGAYPAARHASYLPLKLGIINLTPSSLLRLLGKLIKFFRHAISSQGQSS